MIRIALLIVLPLAVVATSCGGCGDEESPGGVCAELNGEPCDCPDGTESTYDCSAECQCGGDCVPEQGDDCSCANGSAGTLDCGGACQCDDLPVDMGSGADVASADDASSSEDAGDVGADVSSPDDRIMIPAGTFAMGCEGDASCDADEAPVHDVTLSQYWVDRTEVSRGDYEECMDAGDCTEPADGLDLDGGRLADLPVTAVTFDQATAYCSWAGGRLPTEAEWERACTGGDDRIYPWGDEDATCDLANTAGCAPGGANGDANVHSFEAGATPEGALHMAGNAWEWTADWYGDTAYSMHAATDPTGPMTGTFRVYRGGSFGNDPSLARCRNRASTYSPDVGGTGLGFRCAYD